MFDALFVLHDAHTQVNETSVSVVNVLSEPSRGSSYPAHGLKKDQIVFTVFNAGLNN